jgi:hypothetical protein
MRMPRKGQPNDKWVCVDTCLVQEIAELWQLGIETIESCCGHNKALGYIAVQKKHIEQMKKLGYKNQRQDSLEIFLPLTNS